MPIQPRTGRPRAASGELPASFLERFSWAEEALRAAAADAAKSGAVPPELTAPDGWRWRVLTDLRGLAEDVQRGYLRAREKQSSQAWETYLGPLATGGSAAIGSMLAAFGAGVVKSTGGWVLVVLGVVFALGGSLFSANSYVRNRSLKLRYLRLLYDLSDYCLMLLPTAGAADVYAQLDTFRQLWETAGT